MESRALLVVFVLICHSSSPFRSPMLLFGMPIRLETADHGMVAVQCFLFSKRFKPLRRGMPPRRDGTCPGKRDLIS